MMSHQSFRSFPLSPWRLLAGATVLAIAGCGTSKQVTYDPENFNSTDTHARSFDATEAQTCEAARRALLSQGYLVTAANSELVTGKKSFQPANEVHVEVEFRVVCAKDVGGKRKGDKSTIAFVSAVQDRYSLKKVNNSASVGVGVLGSVSLPYSSSDDAMVKVASQTVTDERFYDRFYALIDRYVVADTPDDPPVAAAAPAAPKPAAAEKPSAAAPAPASASADSSKQDDPAAKADKADKAVEPLGVPASMPKASASGEVIEPKGK